MTKSFAVVLVISCLWLGVSANARVMIVVPQQTFTSKQSVIPGSLFTELDHHWYWPASASGTHLYA
jgi:hypothetical protein